MPVRWQDALQWPDADVDHAVQAWWQDLPAPRPVVVAVAFSGGADSTALLLALWRLAQRGGKAGPQRLLALHVHHGLQAAADDFERAGMALCAALAPASGVFPEWHCGRARLQLQPGDSLEARAREARYRMLADLAQAQGAEMVVLAQHADDQVESVLLALTRGAGVAGMAGMAAHFVRHAVPFARPLLSLRGADLRDWLRGHGVPWQEDPSNADHRYTRNRLRHIVLPALEQAVPTFRTGIARSARLAAEADALLQELAQSDLQSVGVPPRIASLQQLGRARQANVLRHWLKQQHGVIGSEAQLRALQQVLAACTTRGHRIHIRIGAGFAVRAGDFLQWQGDSRVD